MMDNRNDEKLYWTLSLAFAVLLILSNTIANRLIVIFGFLLPSAVLVFPITYIIGDIVTEFFGFGKARDIIIISLLLNCVFVILGLFAVSLPAPPEAENVAAYLEVFRVAPRTAIASSLGFFVGSISNAFVMEKLKITKQTQKLLFFRIFTSTVVGEFLDTCLFIGIVFGGALEIYIVIKMIVAQFITKIAYETLFSPLTIIIIRKLTAHGYAASDPGRR